MQRKPLKLQALRGGRCMRGCGARTYPACAITLSAKMHPPITRRDFLRAASLRAAPVASHHAAGAPAVGAAPAFAYAYVGTYTPNGGGIYLFRVDRSSGAMTQLQVVDDIRNPTWLAINPAQTRLYAV